jgi:LysR family transcriptional regulator for bpeEF and oprC
MESSLAMLAFVRAVECSGFTAAALVPALPQFTARFPEITLDLVVTEYPIIDPIDAGIDVAIRIGPLGDVNLVARRVGVLERVIRQQRGDAGRARIAGTGRHPVGRSRARHGTPRPRRAR